MIDDGLITPPHSLEAEQSLLGALMLGDAGAYDDIADIIQPDDFYRAEHRILYASVKRLSERNTDPDIITVGNDLEASGELERAGGMVYINDIIESSPSNAHAVAYAKIVADHAALRRLIAAGREIEGMGSNQGTESVSDILAEAERLVLQVADRGRDTKARPWNAIVDTAVGRIDTLYHSKEPFSGLQTGISSLDEMTNGFAPGDLVIIAARPGMGKSILMQTIYEETSIHNDKLSVVFSLEMPADQLANRSISSTGRISMDRVKSGKLTEEDFPRLAKAVTLLKDRRMVIDDTPGVSPQYMRSVLRRIVREQGDVDLICVDYLQLMRLAGFKDGRVNEVSEISRSLKAIAKEFNCPLVALSQLNRGLENRPNKRPVNSDLRESGAIEQDADVILFIYRDEYYNEDSQDKGISELIIGKQRSGPVGTCRAAFLGHFQRFENLAFSYQERYGDD